MGDLNPTLADGLWPWREGLDRAAMVLSTLVPAESLAATKEVARDIGREGRTVVVTAVGAPQPFFWHVPAGRELNSARPDVVLLLVHTGFTASTRLLLATAKRVMLITGSGPTAESQALKLMGASLEESGPGWLEVVVVSEGEPAARETGTTLAHAAGGRFGHRVSWRHLPARRVEDAIHREKGTMASTRVRSAALSEAEVRAREWEESFRRAERLLAQAQETLRRQLERSSELLAMPDGPAPPRARAG